LAVALEGIDNVLKIGKDFFTKENENVFATVIKL
jgi:hypothetical protein